MTTSEIEWVVSLENQLAETKSRNRYLEEKLMSLQSTVKLTNKFGEQGGEWIVAPDDPAKLAWCRKSCAAYQAEEPDKDWHLMTRGTIADWHRMEA
jgi:hypothetical protein